MRRSSDSRGHYFIIIVLAISGALLLGLAILINTFIWEERGQFRNSGYFRKDLNEYPFFCDDLSLSSDEYNDNFNAKKKLYTYFLHKNRYTCSFWNLTDPLQKFVERLSRLRLASGLEEERYLQCGNESLREPSGHLSAAFRKVSHHQSYEGDGSSIVIHWDKHPENSFISEDLVYHNGAIKVPEGRFYFLYSSILVNLTNVTTRFGNAYRFLLQMCVNTHGYERTLLHKSQTYNPGDTNTVSSLAVGGHVYIAKGDAVYVKVSEASRIILNSAGNVFGIMPLR